MPAEITRLNTFLPLVEKGLRRVFEGELKQRPVEYKAWLREKKAQEWIEDEYVMSGLGSMPEKGVGSPFTVDRPYLSTERQYTLKTYGLAFVIEHELLVWDQYGKFPRAAKLLARSGVDRKNVLAYAILNNSLDGSASSEYLTYASEALCTTSHTLLRGGTGKNAPTSAVGISYLGIQEALTDFALTVNEDGLYAIVKPKHVVCHPSKDWIATTILKSDYRHDTANMEYNTLSGKLGGPHSSPYLTNTNYWWVLAAPDDLEACFSIGQDLMFRKDYQISTWNSTYSMYMSARVEVLTWPGFWGTTGA